MTGLESYGFAEFDRLGELFARTRALLDALFTTGDLPAGAGDVLATETLPHIEDVEAGFRGWLRAGAGELDELRSLILQGGLGLPEPRDSAEQRAALVEAMQARSGAGGDRSVLSSPARRLAALEHARLTFAFLPHTPDDEVRFPVGRRSYADIAAPRTPGELAIRIEELERTVWWLATGQRPVAAYPVAAQPAYRRVYGFFDTAERMSSGGFRLS